MGRAGLINSGGGSGANDMAQAVRTAVINKRGAVIGVISCGGVTRRMGRAQELSKARLLRGHLSREHFGVRNDGDSGEQQQ